MSKELFIQAYDRSGQLRAKLGTTTDGRVVLHL